MRISHRGEAATLILSDLAGCAYSTGASEGSTGWVEVAEGGQFVRVSMPPDETAPFSGGGVRGEVTRFSRQSRMRLLEKLASLGEVGSSLFLTLTYPDVWPGDCERVKRDLDSLGKRLVRRFPAFSWIWRVEVVRRKSGSMEGCEMPHVHVIGVSRSSFSAGQVRTFQRWLSQAWSDVVDVSDQWEAVHPRGANKLEHLRAGTKVEVIRSQRGVMWYTGKYVAKTEDSSGFWRGRYWGCWNRDMLPVGRRLVFKVPGGFASMLLEQIAAACADDFPLYSRRWFTPSDRVLAEVEKVGVLA